MKQIIKDERSIKKEGEYFLLQRKMVEKLDANDYLLALGQMEGRINQTELTIKDYQEAVVKDRESYMILSKFEEEAKQMIKKENEKAKCN